MKPAFALFLLVLLAGCNGSKNHPASSQHIAPKAWQMADAMRYFNDRHIDTSYIRSLLKVNLFRPDQTCTDSVTVYPYSALDDPASSISAIFSTGNIFQKAYSLCAYLYANIPELYIDEKKNYTFRYLIDEQKIDPLLQNLHDAKDAALCGQYAILTKTLLALNLPKGSIDYSTTVNVHDSPDVKFNHTVCLFYYNENGDHVGLVIDAMYGYLFPVRNGTAVPIANVNKAEMKNYLAFLPDSILSQKRFLTDSIWPCNFLTAPVYSYYKGFPEALKKYELHQAEDIRLLSMQPLDTTAYAGGLYRILEKNKQAGY